MEMNFFMPTQIHMGEGCVEKYAQEFRKLGSRALVVTDPVSSRVNGALDDLTRCLKEQGIACRVYDGVQSNPTLGNVRDGMEACRDFDADFLVAAGGGSPMDVAKAISVLVRQEVPEEDIFTTEWTSDVLPLVCVPTTSGTGSEATPYAMIIDERTGTKNNLHSPYLYASMALLDARYTLTLPRTVTINTSIDAMTHCMESIFAVATNPFVQVVAKEGIRSIAGCFGRILQDTLDQSDREKLMLGSVLGGMVAAQTRTTALHGMSYPMTSSSHIPHGRAMALILPNYMRFWEKHEPDVAAELLSLMGLADMDAFAGTIGEMVGEILPEERLPEETIGRYADEVMQKHNIVNTRAPITKEDVIRIYHY